MVAVGWRLLQVVVIFGLYPKKERKQHTSSTIALGFLGAGTGVHGDDDGWCDNGDSWHGSGDGWAQQGRWLT
jgi:hypothetical protein